MSLNVAAQSLKSSYERIKSHLNVFWIISVFFYHNKLRTKHSSCLKKIKIKIKESCMI